MMTKQQMQLKLAQRGAEVVPKGWMTIRQWSKKWGLSRCQTQKIMSDALNAKPPVVERRQFLVLDDGMLLRKMHYREARKK